MNAIPFSRRALGKQRSQLFECGFLGHTEIQLQVVELSWLREAPETMHPGLWQVTTTRTQTRRVHLNL